MRGLQCSFLALVFAQLLMEKWKFSSGGNSITQMVKCIIGCYIGIVERIFACKHSSPWSKRIALMSIVCRSSGNIKYNLGQGNIFLFWMNVVFSFAVKCLLVAPRETVFYWRAFMLFTVLSVLLFLKGNEKYSFGSAHPHWVLSLHAA